MPNIIVIWYWCCHRVVSVVGTTCRAKYKPIKSKLLLINQHCCVTLKVIRQWSSQCRHWVLNGRHYVPIRSFGFMVLRTSSMTFEIMSWPNVRGVKCWRVIVTLQGGSLKSKTNRALTERLCSYLFVQQTSNTNMLLHGHTATRLRKWSQPVLTARILIPCGPHHVKMSGLHKYALISNSFLFAI